MIRMDRTLQKGWRRGEPRDRSEEGERVDVVWVVTHVVFEVMMAHHHLTLSTLMAGQEVAGVWTLLASPGLRQQA